MELIQDNIALKETKVLLDKLINLIYLQSKEIDILQFKVLLKLEHKYQKAKELLDISKNIPKELKVILNKEIEDALQQANGLQSKSKAKEEEN